ncbi:MAG: CHASE3 domain-containing protein [Verrucomicrobiota bacterium]|jgi:CHASE3 domain sensor protein
MKERIKQRVIGLFVLMLGILVFVAWSAVTTINKSTVSSDWVNKTHAFIIEANDILSCLHAGDAALRTYLLTGEPPDQGAYRSAYGEMLEHLSVANALTQHGEEKELQNQQILELETLISNRIDFTRSVVLARAQSGLDAARQFMTAHPDVEPMGKIQRLVENITDQENNLLKQRDQESHLVAQATRTTVYTGVIVNFVLLALVVWLLRDDLAARRRAAQALEDANAQLETKVQERTVELVNTNKSLKQENLERRWSSQALDHQLRYSQLIINTIYELVFVVSRALNISRINPAVSHQTQWEPQELVAQSLDRVLRSSAEDAAGVPPQNPITFAMHEGREIQDREALLLTKSGQTAPVRYSMVPLRDHDKVVGAVVTVRMQNGSRKPG